MYNVQHCWQIHKKQSSERRFRKKETGIKTQSDILLVDEDLAWHHSSATTALWSGGFDVQLFAEVYVETKNIISRVKRFTYHLLFTQWKHPNYRYVYIR